MRQQRQRLLPRFLHLGSRNFTVTCEQTPNLTASQGQEAEENRANSPQCISSRSRKGELFRFTCYYGLTQLHVVGTSF